MRESLTPELRPHGPRSCRLLAGSQAEFWNTFRFKCKYIDLKLMYFSLDKRLEPSIRYRRRSRVRKLPKARFCQNSILGQGLRIRWAWAGYRSLLALDCVSYEEGDEHVF